VLMILSLLSDIANKTCRIIANTDNPIAMGNSIVRFCVRMNTMHM
jgi:hypothetical protein